MSCLACPLGPQAAYNALLLDYTKSPFCGAVSKGTTFTDAAPASCDAPAPAWSCTSSSCWLDTSNRATVLAAYTTFLGNHFGASHWDNAGYEYACMHKVRGTGGARPCWGF